MNSQSLSLFAVNIYCHHYLTTSLICHPPLMRYASDNQILGPSYDEPLPAPSVGQSPGKFISRRQIAISNQSPYRQTI